MFGLPSLISLFFLFASQRVPPTYYLAPLRPDQLPIPFFALPSVSRNVSTIFPTQKVSLSFFALTLVAFASISLANDLRCRFSPSHCYHGRHQHLSFILVIVSSHQSLLIVVGFNSHLSLYCSFPISFFSGYSSIPFSRCLAAEQPSMSPVLATALELEILPTNSNGMSHPSMTLVPIAYERSLLFFLRL